MSVEIWVKAEIYEKLRDDVDSVIDDLTIVTTHMDPHLLVQTLEKLKKALK